MYLTDQTLITTSHSPAAAAVPTGASVCPGGVSGSRSAACTGRRSCLFLGGDNLLDGVLGDMVKYWAGKLLSPELLDVLDLVTLLSPPVTVLSLAGIGLGVESGE